MTISVLIPVYNRPKMILECLESIFNQTYQDIEIIIYNDGSTDETKDILDNLKDPRLTVIHGEQRCGIGFARNRLIELCKTEIACWQDSDDLSHKQKIELQLSVLKPKSFVGCYWQKFRDWNDRKISSFLSAPIDKITTTTKSINDIKNQKCRYGCATVMFYPNLEIKFPENLQLGKSDVIWNVRMAKLNNCLEIEKELYMGRSHNGLRIGVERKDPNNKQKRLIEDKLVQQMLDEAYYFF